MNKIFTGLCICFWILQLSGNYSHVQAQQIVLSPQPLYFGQTPDGRDTFRNIVIRNTSGETLNINQINIQGANASEFSVVDNPGSLNISAFGRIELMVNFNPQSVGDKQAQIVFQSNAASSPDIIDFVASATDVSSGLITFEKMLGTIEGDGASDVRITADGGFIICGNTDNVDEESNDGYLVKTNAYGEVEWSEVYDSDDNDENSDGFSSVIPVSDGYIAVGSTDNGARDLDLWVVKTDLNGVLQWDKIFGGTDDDGASAIEKTNDGNFIIAGYSFPNVGETGRDGFLIKIDGQGNELWSQAIGGPDSENYSSVKQTDDGGYIIAGIISTGGIGSDMLLVKTNSSGVESWSKQFGNSGEANVDGASSVIIAPDGGFVITGSTTSFGDGANDVYVIKTDANGVKNQTWGDKTFGEAHRDGGSEVITTSDGGFLIVGSIENFYEPLPINDWYSDVFIIKLDQSGNLQWDNVYGGIRSESASSVRELSDGSFIICGRTNSYGSNADSDIYLLRVNKDGNITGIENDLVITPAQIQLAQNYPNPFNSTTTIAYNISKNMKVQVKVFDLTGRLIEILVDEFQETGLHRISYDAKSLASGVYFYQLVTGDFVATKRLLLIK